MPETLLSPLISALARFLATHSQANDDLTGLVEGSLRAEDPRVLFALAPRLVGKGPALFSQEDLSRVPWPITHFAIDEAVRTLVLARSRELLSVAGYESLVDACWRHGEVRERVAVLKALPFLPRPERFVHIASDACRTHLVPVFEAIACENPLPAQHFDANTFRQMVLKAMFIEVKVGRIFGLLPRIDAELVRMTQAYIDERRAAGRSVPDDATWLVAQQQAQEHHS